jgi:hypothetical protein
MPAVDLTLPPGLLVADAARRSPRAHLHKLLQVLVDIASLDGATKIVGEGEDGERTNARELAKLCLRAVGTELGAEAQTRTIRPV